MQTTHRNVCKADDTFDSDSVFNLDNATFEVNYYFLYWAEFDRRKYSKELVMNERMMLTSNKAILLNLTPFIARVSRLRNPACILLWRTERTVSCREYKKPIVTRQSHTENGYLTNKSNMWSQSGKSSRACLHKSVAISM